jgi:hypothetical protein
MVLAILDHAKLMILGFAVVLLCPPGWAQAPKTAVLLTVSGVRPSEYWKKSDYISIAGEGAWHVALGTLAVRSMDTSAREVLVSANGDLEFFDVEDVKSVPGAGPGVAWPATRAAWPLVIHRLRSAGKLRPACSVKLTADLMTRQIGYMVRVPEPGPLRSSAQVVIAVPGAEPATLPISMEIAESQPLWRDPVFTAFSGAVVGFGFFVLQQLYTRKADARKRFEERKIEKGTELWRFFHNTYPPLVGDRNLTELERARNVRRTLLEESVYPLLPLDVATTLNRICDGKDNVSSPLASLETELRTAFAEFMS